eukprot:jgi/Botrbrau1/21096/Bobra.0669s0002.1
MDSMRTAGVLCGAHAISSVLLGVAVTVQADYYSGYTYITVDFLEQAWRALILLASAGCFKGIVTTEGKDITLLLEGLGKERGVGRMFDRFQKVLWASAFWRSIDITIRIILATAAFQAAGGQAGPPYQ